MGMVKANKKFDLSVRDIEIIEQALRAKAGRRGLAIANGETSPQLKEELRELQELLGRIHDQKVWFRPKNKIYVSG
jgi:hypothetical protein